MLGKKQTINKINTNNRVLDSDKKKGNGWRVIRAAVTLNRIVRGGPIGKVMFQKDWKKGGNFYLFRWEEHLKQVQRS